jgi:glycosyl transferase family 87
LKAWQDQRLLLVVYVTGALLAGVAKYCASPKPYGPPWARVTATQYNNYVIFKSAGLHLAAGKNLYQIWPKEHWDQFKYSPTFAAAMWPMAMLPDLVGLCLWNVAGALSLLFAIRALPLSPQATAIAAWLVFKDQLTSLQNAQSNSLMAALMILTFVGWERGRLLAAAIALALSLYIKIFGVAVALLWIAFPHRFKSLLWIALAVSVLGLAPLLLTSPENLWQQYHNWFSMLHDEFPQSEGISAMGILHAWFGLTGHKTLTLLIGSLILLAPLIRVNRYDDLQFRLGLLASALIWVVLFNHRAESATFVIATAGVAVWFVSRPITPLNIALAVLTMVLSGFSSNELMPKWLQQHFLEPYHLKALPSLLVWIKLQGELWSPALPEQPNRACEPTATTTVLQRAA